MKQKQFFKTFARDYLNHLGNPNPTNKQLTEIQTLLSQAWVQRPICVDGRLTNREQQCLYLSSQEKSIKEIAIFLAISERQVDATATISSKNSNAKTLLNPLPKDCVMGTGVDRLPGSTWYEHALSEERGICNLFAQKAGVISPSEFHLLNTTPTFHACQWNDNNARKSQ
ncbi:helix-turn-helix domain-containing protein [Legionella tunisiensis]|uniref:hypothetical protein n=1 Tax=Legionella tunisiensis TaxID=1034944 RepID=UPI001E312DD8|nr:hypothetical protein [Legionella tunisiensis]